MKHCLAERLSDAVAAHLAAPNRAKVYEEALAAYGENPQDHDAREALIAVIDERQKTQKPLDDLLHEAWCVAIAGASARGVIQMHDQGDAATVFGNVWKPLVQEGWTSLPDYRHEQLSEALAQTVRSITFDLGARPEGTASEIATAMLADIEAGNIARGPGTGDFFINWADGTPLTVEMKSWAPKLTDKGKAPHGTPDGFVFTTQVTFETGRILVADAIRIDPLPRRLSWLRSALGLNINYGWHRILRTVHTANIIGAIDVAMGDDGPGLVRAPDGETVFAGDVSENFPEIADVCHDYWGTTMIDRSDLLALMIKHEAAADIEDAEADIDAWLEESEFHSQIEVPAGTWHFYWDDDRETLDAELRAAGVAAPENTRFVLSRHKLAIPKHRVIDMMPPSQ